MHHVGGGAERWTEGPQRHALHGGALSGEAAGLSPTLCQPPVRPVPPGTAPAKCRFPQLHRGSQRCAAQGRCARCSGTGLAPRGQRPCGCQAAAHQVASLQGTHPDSARSHLSRCCPSHWLLQWGQGGQAAGGTLILGQGHPLCPFLQREAGLPSSQLSCRPQSR